MPSVSPIFLAHVSPDRRDRFERLPDLESALTTLIAQGRAVWTEIPLPEGDFMAFLGRRLPDHASADLAVLRGDELWLVCAFGRGVPGAAEALDRHYLKREAAALARRGAPPPVIEDILQEIRERLVEMAARGDRRAYAGTGSLGGWLRVAAVRLWSRQRGRLAREQTVGGAPSLIASPDHDPEAALLKKIEKAALITAFQGALASLSPRDRSVLRFHFVEGLTIDALGARYRVHRSTAARWIERACRALSERTSAAFREEIAADEAGFQRVVGLIGHQIEVELARVEHPAAGWAGALPPAAEG